MLRVSVIKNNETIVHLLTIPNTLMYFFLDNSSENYWLAEMPSDGGYQRHTESCGVAELKGSDKEIKWRRVKCAQSYLFICL